jgi:hypothetical protein
MVPDRRLECGRVREATGNVDTRREGPEAGPAAVAQKAGSLARDPLPVAMRDLVTVDIGAPRDRVAALFADPRNNPQWMEDVERYEPLQGNPGMPGSSYRLVPKKGKMVFVATVVERSLPRELRLDLQASNVAVVVKGTLSELSSTSTRLVSEEVFTFKGPFGKAMGLFARGAIRKAHRDHMKAFKRFAERQA